MSAVGVLARRFLADYARTPVNLLMLLVVPTTFVVAAAGPLSDAAELLGGRKGEAVPTATAGWAAGFLSGVAMYFQVAGSRDVDRRLTLAGLPARALVAARITTGAALALGSSAVALLSLALRTGVHDPARAIPATLLFAATYLAIGAIIGSIVRTPVNGVVVILLIWILDVFFGPALGTADLPATRALPTHFLTMWMLDLPSGHSGPVGDLGLALLWAAAMMAIAAAVLDRQARPAPRARAARHSYLPTEPRSAPASPHPSRPRRRRRAIRARSQTRAAIVLGLRDYARNRVLWLLLVAVPAIFILGAVATTPAESSLATVVEHGRRVQRAFWLPDIHGGTMVPIAVASLAALTGLFVTLDNRRPDMRLATAGYTTGAILTMRLTIAAAMTTLAVAVSLATAAPVFHAGQWPLYAAANLLLALTYAFVGVILGAVFGRVAGVFMAFLVPFLDLGIGQSPMLNAVTPGWARFPPGYGASQVITDAALTRDFDEKAALLLGLAWFGALLVIAAALARPAIHRGHATEPLPAHAK